MPHLKLLGLMARWEPGDDTPENGIPCLRFRDFGGGRGLTFYFPRSEGAVSFTGIDISTFVKHAPQALHESALTWAAEDDPAPQEERAWSDWKLLDEYVAASVVARRLGLLLAGQPRWVHAWWNRPGRISVEIGVHHDAPDPIPNLLKRIQSPYFAPRLHLERRYRDGDYHIPLSIEGTREEIDLRLLRVSQ